MPGNRTIARWLSVAAAGLAFTTGALDMPQIVSHRGESQDRPENTMAAFRLAFERGVDGVECDVYATTDGVPVIIHDGTTGRTAGSGTNLTVTSSSWNDPGFGTGEMGSIIIPFFISKISSVWK